MNNLIKSIKETNWAEFYKEHVSFDYLADGSTHVKVDGETMITIGRSVDGY